MSRENYFIFTLTMILMNAAGLFATDIYLPALPEMTQFFNCTQTEIQSSFTVFLIGLAVCQLIYGVLADRFGRKRIVLCSILLFIVASIFCALASTLTEFIIFRLFQAIGGGAGSVVSRAMIIDRYNKTETVKIFSTIFPIIGLSAAVAPLLGGYLTTFFEWRATFYFMALFGCITFLLVSFCLTNKPTENKLDSRFSFRALFSGYKLLAKNMNFLAYVLIICIGFCVFRCFAVESPFVFDNQGFLAEEMGRFYISLSVSYIIGNLLAKYLINYKPAEKVIKLGFVFFVLGGFLMVLSAFYFSQNPYAVILPMSIVTLGNGFLFPIGSASAMASVPSTQTGMASGLMGSFQFIAAALCIYCVGGICHGEALLLSVFIGAIIIVGVSSFLILTNRQKNIQLKLSEL